MPVQAKPEIGKAWADFSAEVGCPIRERRQLPVDSWTFATKCCVTLDELAAGKVERKPFPEWSYLKTLIETVSREQFVRIDKSGQVLVSWGLIAYFLCEVLNKRGFRLAYYCQTATKAEGHVDSRFYRMYLSIPSEYEKPHAEFKNGCFLVYHDGPGNPATSFVIPQAAEQGKSEDAADKMRSETWTAALLDEGGFYPNLQELLDSLLPRCGRVLLPSTANGNNYFRVVGFGNKDRPTDECVEFDRLKETGEVIPLQKGVWQWRRNGFCCLRIHYSAHPDRDPDTAQGAAWRDDKLSRSSMRLWNREQEISYDVAAGRPVFEQTDRIKFVEQQIRGWLRFFGTWDYGYAWPFSYVFQIEAIEEKKELIVHVLHEFVRPNTEIYEFGLWVKGERERLYGLRDWSDYGDDAGRQHSDKGVSVETLQSIGITVISQPTGPGGVLKRNILMQRLITGRCLEIDPQCKFLKTALQSGYIRDDEGEAIGGEKGHPYADGVESLLYGLINVLGLEYQPTGQPRMIEGTPLPGVRPAGNIPSLSPLTRPVTSGQSKVVEAERQTATCWVPKRFDPKAPVRRGGR